MSACAACDLCVRALFTGVPKAIRACTPDRVYQLAVVSVVYGHYGDVERRQHSKQ